MDFCLKACSKLLVTEVRRRASNQSTEQAAGAIAQFLEVGLDMKSSCNPHTYFVQVSANETDSQGWMLISTVNLLAAGQTLY